MTDKEKHEFLELEGFRFGYVSLVFNPEDGMGWRCKDGWPYTEGEAFRIASRRKASRERARIRRHGFWYNGHGRYFNDSLIGIELTRQEAIAYLDRMENEIK